MKTKKYTFHPKLPGDFSLRDYIKLIACDHIKDIQLVHNDVAIGERAPNHWQAIAIKFIPGLKQMELFEAIVSLKADEYWGVQNGYHIFWWD